MRNKVFIFLLGLPIICFFLSACISQEEVIVSENLNAAEYGGDDIPYRIILPDEEWYISGEDDYKNIVFENGDDVIEITEISDRDLDNIINDLPKTQEAFEAELKAQGKSSYDIYSFKSFVDYRDNSLIGVIYCKYSAYDSAYKMMVFDIYTDNVLYKLTGYTKDDDVLDYIESSFRTFTIIDRNKEIIPEYVEKYNSETNVYTSGNNDFTLDLSYKNWEFENSVDDSNLNGTINITKIFADNIEIVISSLSNGMSLNSITYAVPKNIDTLNKQLEMEKLSSYELVGFNETTCGVLDEDTNEMEYASFSYLIKLNNDPSGTKYYSYLEYRLDDVVYKITGKIKTDDIESVNELKEIINSFSLIY